LCPKLFRFYFGFYLVLRLARLASISRFSCHHAQLHFVFLSKISSNL
jgi:hypothetical protein